MSRERTPTGQFTGVTRISGAEIFLCALLGSVVGVIGVFVLLSLVK
jgi:hypothetical protein